MIEKTRNRDEEWATISFEIFHSHSLSRWKWARIQSFKVHEHHSEHLIVVCSSLSWLIWHDNSTTLLSTFYRSVCLCLFFFHLLSRPFISRMHCDNTFGVHPLQSFVLFFLLVLSLSFVCSYSRFLTVHVSIHTLLGMTFTRSHVAYSQPKWNPSVFDTSVSCVPT